MMDRDTTSTGFFEAKYQGSADPWCFASSPYEQMRYRTIVHAVHDRRYRHAFEPGCSIGVLTEQLARFCGRVDACDLSSTATASACARTRHLPHVRVTCGGLPDFVPDAALDLIVFSEIGYYFASDALYRVVDTLVDRMTESGLFLAAHWLGESADHLLSGDRVHEIVNAHRHLMLESSARPTGFRLDVWRRT